MPGYGLGDGYGGMDGFGNTGGSQTGESSGNKGDQDTDTSPQGMMTGVVDSQGNVVGYGPTNALGNQIGTVMGTNVNAPDFGGLERAGLQAINSFRSQYGTQQPGLSPTTTGFSFGLPSLGLPSLDQLSQFNTDVNKFAFNPMLGIVSGLTGFPIGAVLGLANALGAEIGPAPADDPSQTRGRDVLTAENQLDAENNMQATLDAASNLTAAQLEKLKGLITMGYPEDYALQVAQLT